MRQKTVLVVDDEIGYAEALRDALNYEGFRVLTATTGEEALDVLRKEQINLVTIDVMMPPGRSLESQITSDRTGVLLCKTIRQRYPHIYMICISVVTNRDTIKEIESYNIRFLRKGEVPLRTVLDHITTKLRGRIFTSSGDD